jgi:glycosyltransferase involved in cell wall biosynthesis
MRICHITPHLPPDQAANALLPFQLGRWTRDRGGECSFVAHPPRAQSAAADPLPGPVVWIPRHDARGLLRTLRVSAAALTIRIARAVTPAIARADVVHVHSNGLLSEVGALLARRYRKPVVLTLYGTEIWHYRPKRLLPDFFTRAYRRATHVTFYSRGLRDRALELGLARDRADVVYPPVATGFVFHNASERDAARRVLGLAHEHLILNVKRLHPLAGQRYLVEAMAALVRTHPRAHLIICGTGPARHDLEGLASSLNLTRHITFAGLVGNEDVAKLDAAADVFALPSTLEALPTVAVEALATGTPVISADNPGGVELNALFGNDVTIVPRQNGPALARALVQFLSNKRRTTSTTADVLDREFGAVHVAERFHDIYQQAVR